MDQAVRRMRLLGLPGSLRKASYSRAVLRGLKVELGAATEFEIRDLRLPLYNEDEDGADAPEIIRQFRRAIDQSDDIVIGNVAEKILQGRLVDQPNLRFALSAIDRLAAACNVR